MTTISISGHRKTQRANLVTQLWNWLLVARQRRELAQLDEHALEDIGLTRADVAREIERPVWDVPCHWRG